MSEWEQMTTENLEKILEGYCKKMAHWVESCIKYKNTPVDASLDFDAMRALTSAVSEITNVLESRH